MAMPVVLSLPLRTGILLFCLSIWLGQYFLINNSNLGNRTRKNWSTNWDLMIPFVPQMTIPYISAYIFGILPFLIIEDVKLFFYTLLGYFMVTFIGSGMHVVFPSQILSNEKIEPTGISMTLLYWVRQISKPYDNFPSTHVAFSVLTVGTCSLSRGPAFGGVLMIWALVITASTLLTKQHYFLDVVSGSLLGLAAFILVRLICNC